MVKPQTGQQGHETRDISVRAVSWFAIGLVLSCVAIAAVVIGLFRILEQRHPSPDSASRIALQPQMIAPPPQLQVAPTSDYEEFRASDETRLNSYGWVDKEASIVRIPIERAMDLIAARGLPTRGDGTPDASGITSVQMQERKAGGTK